MRRKLLTQKVSLLLLSLCMAITIIPPISVQAYGASYGNAVDTVCLGIDGISNPKEGEIITTGSAQAMQISVSPWSGDYIYFGTYEGRPIKWRVLDTEGTNGNSSIDGKMLLHSDKILEKMTFSGKQGDESWENSAVRKWLAENYTSWFTSAEQSAICSSVLKAGTSPYTWVYSVGVNGDKLFALDITDVCNTKYGYYLSENSSQWWIKGYGNLELKNVESGKTEYWWLRSGSNPVFSDGQVLGDSDPAVALGTTDGDATWGYADYNSYGVAPALNLDKEDVVMSTMVGTAKTADFDTIRTAKAGGNGWYLTFKDGGNVTSIIDFSESVSAGSAITAEITSITKGSADEYTQISALLEKGNSVYAYGKISGSVSAGKVAIQLPANLSEGSYTLKIFAEAVNESGTSYASEGSSHNLTITSKANTSKGDASKSDDENISQTKNEKIIAGVKATTIKAKATAGKGYIKITWTKSKGYKVDKYQIYKSTKKSSGYKKSFTTTKTSYKNTKELKKGARYYYKVRGVRVINGKNYYTKWSNIVTRIAIK